MRKEHLGFSLAVAAVFILRGFAAVVAGELPTGAPVGALGPDSHGALSAGSVVARPDTFGTVSWTAINYPATDFVPRGNGQWAYNMGTTWAYRSGGSNTMTCTGIHIPSGALWPGVSRWTNDTDATYDLLVEIYKVDLEASTSSTLYSWSSSGAPGIQRTFDYFGTAETVDNFKKAYSVCIYSPQGGVNTLEFAGIGVWYQLQVSPAPATATFSDVPTSHWAFKFVEALAASGITSGCAAGQFCPNNPITRAEMAVFLSAALGLHWGDLY